jgi:hypothetical protein
MIELYQLPANSNGTLDTGPKQATDAYEIVPIIPPESNVSVAATTGPFTRDQFQADLRKIKKQRKAR